MSALMHSVYDSCSLCYIRETVSLCQSQHVHNSCMPVNVRNQTSSMYRQHQKEHMSSYEYWQVLILPLLENEPPFSHGQIDTPPGMLSLSCVKWCLYYSPSLQKCLPAYLLSQRCSSVASMFQSYVCHMLEFSILRQTAVICNCKIFLQAQHIENYFMYLFISEFGKLDNWWRSFSGVCSSFINCRI